MSNPKARMIMKELARTAIKERFPSMFEERPPFRVGLGWMDEILCLCEEIEKLDPNIKIGCIKEKFGTLRFYTSGTVEEVNDLIHYSENRSSMICEDCGSRKWVTTEGGWIRTLCRKCRSEDT